MKAKKALSKVNLEMKPLVVAVSMAVSALSVTTVWAQTLPTPVVISSPLSDGYYAKSLDITTGVDVINNYGSLATPENSSGSVDATNASNNLGDGSISLQNITNNSTITTDTHPNGIELVGSNVSSAVARATSIVSTISDASSVATATASAVSSVEVAYNKVTNSGAVNATSTGILLRANSEANALATAYADAWANNDGSNNSEEQPYSSASASVTELSSEALLHDNTIRNTGVIRSVGNGIELSAQSFARSESDAAAFNHVGLDGAAIGYSTWPGLVSVSTPLTSSSKAKVLDNNVINSGTIVSSGGDGINLSATADIGVLAADGWVIPTSVIDGTVVVAQVNGNTIQNSGSITAAGAGIQLKALAESGDLANYGQDTYSNLATVDRNTVVNSGSINADGNGISLYAYTNNADWGTHDSQASVSRNDIRNSGTIIAAGTGIELYAETDVLGASMNSSVAKINTNTVTNSGLISAQRDGVRLVTDIWDGSEGALNLAVSASINGNSVLNSGRIYAADDGITLISYGASSDYAIAVDNNIITNAGRIVAGGVGINLQSDFGRGHGSGNVITNSGLIVSDPGLTINGASIARSNSAEWNVANATAIRVEMTTNELETNQLNLNAPGYIAGRILLQNESNTTVNLVSGVSHSVRWAVENEGSYRPMGAGVTSGTLPWFVSLNTADSNANNNVYATIDPSAFAAAPNQVANLSTAVSDIVRSSLSTTKSNPNAVGLWAAASGSWAKYDGNNSTTFNQKLDTYAVTLGYNTNFGDATKASFFFGGSDGRLKVGSLYSDVFSNSYDNKAHGFFGGAAISKTMGGAEVDFGLTAGRQNNSDKRFVNDNLKWWGISYASASYNSTWYSPELGVSYPVALGNFSLVPNARVAYIGEKIGGYTESGSDSNATVNSRTLGLLQTKVGVNLERKYESVKYNLGVGYLRRTIESGDNVTATMLGDTHSFSSGFQTLNTGYAQALVGVSLTKDLDLNLSGNYLKNGATSAGTAQLLLKAKF